MSDPRPGLLGAVVFLSSAAVLVLEILAARILAPYVGVTLQSFTAIIGTILAAIALGAWAGGKLADRIEPQRLLGPVLVIGGLLSVATPAAVDFLGQWLRGGHPLVIVALATVGFFAPAAVLSMVTPIVAKIALSSIDRTGTVVGSLSALATIGAIFGTFAAGFFLVATFPSRPITWVVGAIAVLMGVSLSLPGARRYAVGGVVLLVLTIAASAAVASPCRVETAYYCAHVRPDPKRPAGRSLILDTLRHGYVDLSDPSHLEIRYIRVMARAAEALRPRIGEAVYLGGGAFTLPAHFQASQGTRATVLELDEALVELVERELGLRRGPWLDVRTGDGRLTMQALPSDSAEVLFGDAFGGLAVPWHLATEEFTREVRRVLRPGGFYIINVVDYPPTRFVRAETATIARVFEHVAVVAPPALLAGQGGGNYVVVASDVPIDTAAIEARMTDGEVAVTGEAVRGFVGASPVLTDAYAPVDQLLGKR
ncbi:MAG: fused MFS/spermidine synthase [Myxococcales bacterium]|nr:fused MFS/spermidine synthase [Myxococcales bacterium]